MKRPKPVVLISMDGVGVAAAGPGNAVVSANTMNLDRYWPIYPHTYLEASGLNVGLPSGTDGNSEVGHMTMGAGKIIFQNLPKIDNAIQNESFYSNEVLKEAFESAKKNNKKIHIMGLVGTGVVHASLDHMLALIKFAEQEGIEKDKLIIHVFTDGRDSMNNVAVEIIEKIESYCFQKKVGRIASVIGRAFAMDRNRNWTRTKVAYDMLTKGSGQKVKDYKNAIKDLYKKGIYDEYIEPTLIENEKGEIDVVEEGDSLIFTNFRPDRAVQLTMAFEDDQFKGFDREKIKNLIFVGMADYEEGFPKKAAFPQEKVTSPLGKVISDAGMKQLRVAESEKFPHVTYFFNGQNKEIYPGESWLEIPSPKDVATYDQKPEMSQRWVAEVVVDKINKEDFDFILVNFAGPDMVAHTGNIEATIKSLECCDESIGKIVDATLKKGGAVVITADHGNAEEMLNLQTQEPDTKHSTNNVPFIIIQKGLIARELTVGGLADVATTVLALLGLKPSKEMNGRNLLG